MNLNFYREKYFEYLEKIYNEILFSNKFYRKKVCLLRKVFIKYLINSMTEK